MTGVVLAQVDPWVVGALVTINVAAFTAVGAALWAVYGSVTSIKTALHGANGDKGFIEKTEASHDELAEETRQVRRQVQAQGHLLNEVAYGARELADRVNDHLDADDAVELGRLEDVHRRTRKDRDRWDDESAE